MIYVFVHATPLWCFITYLKPLKFRHLTPFPWPEYNLIYLFHQMHWLRLVTNLLYTQPTDWFSKQALSVSSMCFLIHFITGTTLETTLKNKRYHHQHQEQSHHLVAHTGTPSLVQTLILVGAQNADKHCLRTASIMEEFESRCINAKKSDSHSMQKQHLMLLGAHPILRSSLHVHVIGWDHSKNRSARVTNARLVLVWKYFYKVS